jgi:chromosome partitioning protein
MSARVIGILNQKGGVGKTTTTLNLGAALQQNGNTVLLLDLDQQGSLTTSCGLVPEELDQTIYNSLSEFADPKIKMPLSLSRLITTTPAGLELIPANIELAALDLELTRAYSREHILKRALEPLRARYDYILLDCAPSLSLLVVNALTAANEIIIPLQADYLAAKGLKLLLESIEAATSHLNPDLKITGILITMADHRTGHTKQIIELTRSNFSGDIKVFDTMIKNSVRLKEAPMYGQSILQYDPKSGAAEAYMALALEVQNGR